MFSKAEKLFGGVLLIVCIVVGIAGYSFPRTSSPPSKVWFDASGGDVIFDHAYHVTLAECYDCHHNFDEQGTAPETEKKCRDCHYYGEARDLKSEDATHPHFIGANCIECHKSVAMEIVCDACHVRQGFAFEESSRVMPPLPETVKFDTDAGIVNFDHKVHISKDVGEPCIACHHECKEGIDMKGMACNKNCRACHYEQADKIPECDNENHARYIGANCAHCHDGDDCSQCHEE
ncbi:MAG: cytochrome c3 family protein [Deltaproteobacteria bacterium]|nr:cytochrome c3 family protein [Deltaproteobacteria bacterium]